jgi:hypothetical protein
LFFSDVSSSPLVSVSTVVSFKYAWLSCFCLIYPSWCLVSICAPTVF